MNRMYFQFGSFTFRYWQPIAALAKCTRAHLEDS